MTTPPPAWDDSWGYPRPTSTQHPAATDGAGDDTEEGQ